jgi:hypothetical protein
MSLLRSTIPILALSVLACGGPDVQPVTVRVSAPSVVGEVVPIAGADLTLLPFDIDSVYAELEKKNQAGAQPDTAQVEAAFQAFYGADTALVAADSLMMARQRALEPLTDRTSPQYREAFNAYRRAEQRRDSVSAERDSAEARFGPIREGYNRARATWEASAWDGLDRISERQYELVSAPEDTAGEELPFKHRTKEDGSFTVHLGKGRWWVAGRAAVPGATRQLYRWNQGFTVGEQPVTVELTGENARRLSTY